ncbi:hypothetical protein MNBD_GAMMA10-2876 [hydrothermal vent metagenome]|uniref:N-acetyltransferase domain-containing protein n=1 Tax=hydrothermal vent metagenome TaxID=652676 RepID=A0A3B0YEP6_9ZZZZ
MLLFDKNLPAGLALRPAREADNYFLENLYRSTRDDLRLLDAETDFIETLIEQQHDARTTGYGERFPDAMYFIIEMSKEPIGQIVINFAENEVRLIDVSLIPAARNKGYGKSLIEMLQYASAVVNAPLRLSVHKQNMLARGLYQRLGFQLEHSGEISDVMVWVAEGDLAAHR